MKTCVMSKSNTNHNLNLQMYSFQEILQLFNLSDATNITPEQLKQAKLLVLKTHPDKSHLPSEYFLFYKKAFEIIVEIYNNQQRTTKEVPKTKLNYSNEIVDISTGTGKHSNNSIQLNETQKNKMNDTIESMPPAKFHQTFNELFEKNQMGRKIVNKNEWFTNEDENMNVKNNNIKSVSAMNGAFEKIKENQQGMTVYKGVKETPLVTISCANLYEDVEDELTQLEMENESYIETDPFSKLKFEDIKKVHKNETVFAVSEKNYNNIKKYSSVEEYNKERNTSDISLKSEEENLRIIKEKETEFQNKMIYKQYQLKKKELEIEQKNKSILSYFLQLT